MRVVVALGGNAILRRDQQMTVANQRASIAAACGPLARIAAEHELIVSHGNGPQIGLLALQAAAYDHVSEYPFDVLGASTEGMIGYLIEQELGNQLGNHRVVTTLVTRTEVDARDPAFHDPTKFVGPGYADEAAAAAAEQNGWTMKRDGTWMRRVVPSPRPHRIVELQPIQWLLEKRAVVICAGGGGVPTLRTPPDLPNAPGDVLMGVEAVIDKDLASAVLARDLHADLLIIATDVDGVYLDWHGDDERRIVRAHPDALDPDAFPAGSMGPKVRAAVQFAHETSGTAVIGSLQDIDAMLAGRAGTTVSRSREGMDCHWTRTVDPVAR
ncbi:carbamate kinase [Aeromicrobium sp. 9AM]|uniref:carbamate kinase n=1 Tax=Aeromicrobium sp. 9AM TaxID=2653126 RepID=UPI0012F278B7|nr:carbamate kinase [Aeromicrobium sp. 9AM]VXC11769.1 Carbamate kinase [Aeromicrobium sp. 9AM]